MAAPAPDLFATVQSSLGPDALLLAELSGTESLSKLFSFELSLLSEARDLPFADIVGKDLTIAIDVEGTQKRFLHGIVAGFSHRWIAEADGSGFSYSIYTAGLVPRLWLLTRHRASRIFQDLSVPEIVLQILGEREIHDYRLDLDPANYPKREYCVQYRETEYAFLARLLEDEGIYFYFEHEEGKHTWVLADGSVPHRPCPVQGYARYRAGAGSLVEGAVVADLVMGQRMRATRYTLKDFDFEQPELDLSASIDAGEPIPPDGAVREVYDYPGTHRTLERGEQLSTLRMEEEDAQVTTLRGTSSGRAFSTGFLFALESQGRPELDGKQYLLTSVEHHLRQPGFHTRGAAPGAASDPDVPRYRNRFECVPAGTQFRPPRITPKPTIQGPQTAIVVGPSSGDIYTDKYGRVKVQFHWDREGRRNENSSCWVRVSQVWAGHGWGGMHIPHVGHEVVVSFLEGDPDQPLVTGRVYHAGNPVPEPLPDNKRKSILRDDYGNELIFDATPGDEHIRLHSPHHNSTLTLGKSFGGFTADNHFEAHGGDMAEVGMGNKYELFAGNALEVALGVANEAKFGLTHEYVFGGKFDFLLGFDAGVHVGPELKYHVGPTVENCNETIGSVSEKHNVVSAKQKLNLVGGAGGDSTSIIEADSKRVSMSIGNNKNPNKDITLPEKIAFAAIPGIVGLASVAAMLIQTGFAELSEGETRKNVVLWTGVAETAMTLAEIVGYFLLWKRFEREVAPVSHRDDPRDEIDAVISLDRKMKGKGRVHLYGTDEVTLGVEEDVLRVLGKPGTTKLKPKGAQLKIDLRSVSMSEWYQSSPRSTLEVTSAGIKGITKKSFKVDATGAINFKCSKFEANRNLTVVP